MDNINTSKNSTAHQFPKLSNDYSVLCSKVLKRIYLVESLDIDTYGNMLSFQSSLPYFHPFWHAPPTNLTNDIDISPVEGYVCSV